MKKLFSILLVLAMSAPLLAQTNYRDGDGFWRNELMTFSYAADSAATLDWTSPVALNEPLATLNTYKYSELWARIQVLSGLTGTEDTLVCFLRWQPDGDYDSLVVTDTTTQFWYFDLTDTLVVNFPQAVILDFSAIHDAAPYEDTTLVYKFDVGYIMK